MQDLMTDIAVRRTAAYRRHLEHGDFSLEANTDAAPEPGHFFLMRGKEVLLRTDDFRTAEAAYQEHCRQHWEQHLHSEDRMRRMASAWGLLGLELEHREASLVIERDGTLDAQRRLTRMRSRLKAVQAHQLRTAQRAKR